MIVYARPGGIARVPFDGLPTGLVGTAGVRVMAGADAVTARTTAGIIEIIPGSGAYLVEVAAPLVPGSYQVVLDDGLGGPAGTMLQALEVTSLPLLGSPPAGAPEWAPTLELVALVTPSYTRGGFDDDDYQAGGEQGTYTPTTNPTAQHVESLIVAACAEVTARVGFTIPLRCFELARSAALWHVASAISAGKLPAQTDDAAGEHRAHSARFLDTLEELVDQARQPRALRIA